ncbi:hypothetical protein UFOVP707_41 [uncultured Caudovirales phage]|uniref:Uncharacterized protein n=1 Tax=uncultured Caudovirales phage TaxID=2100421 RepID=A0A6J5NNN2_9CAUD|nr:hypothetical protein UFOVP707_41 [uncultured Caudovirales phage]
MNFLQLCQALRREAGLPGTGPSSVASQTGIYAQVVQWILQADAEILAMHDDWRFLWRRGVTTLTPGVATYASLPGLPFVKHIWRRSVRRGANSNDPVVRFVPFEHLDRQPAQNASPTIFARAPGREIQVWPTPTLADVLRLDYQALPAPMVNNTDTSEIPEAHRMAIVYRALSYYAVHNEDGGAAAQAQMMWNIEFHKLAEAYLPGMGTRITPLDGLPQSELPELV